MAKSTLKFLFLTLLLCLGLKGYAMTNIFVISNKTYLGDRANLFGIAEELKSHISNSEIKEFSQENLNEASSLIDAQAERAIVISAGKYGINSILTLKKQHRNKILAIHVFHQVIKESNLSHKDLINKADIIALPSHSLSDDLEKEIRNSNTQLVKTIGVAHNSKREDLISAYENDSNILPKSNKYLGIILPGDAPDSNGEMKYYTPQMAAKLALNVSKLAKENNYAVLITNGPRTGKHNPNNGEVLVNHQDGIIDDVTKKFVEVLDSKQIKYKLFDFQRGQKNYKNLIFGTILKHEGSMLLAPGESTSMISESIDLMDPGKVTIYMNEAMNENHKRHVMSEFENNRAHIMDSEAITQSAVSDHKSPSAREVVAKAILEKYLND